MSSAYLASRMPSWYNGRMRSHTFANGEFYHIFNRGVDKRNIFLEKDDFARFLLGMEVFNTAKPIGSIYEHSFLKKDALGSRDAKSRLVDIVCYCLNPNHYHFTLEQLVDDGVSSYMGRLSGGFAQYFNRKYKRSGALFESRYKSTHVVSNEQLLHTSAYINLNDRVHGLRRGASVSSWHEYLTDLPSGLCKKDIILKQFKNIAEYRDFAEGALVDMQERKQSSKELRQMLLE